ASMHSTTTDRRSASKCGKMAKSDRRLSVRITRGAGSGQHVLQEGRENANIDAGLGFIWRLSAGIVSPLLGSQADAGVGDRKLNPVASVRRLAKGENQRARSAERWPVPCGLRWTAMEQTR